jgi:hypothetical protein
VVVPCPELGTVSWKSHVLFIDLSLLQSMMYETLFLVEFLLRPPDRIKMLQTVDVSYSNKRGFVL